MTSSSKIRLREYPLYGAAIDVIAFFASFVFFGGAHGPAGPMFMLWVINKPFSALRLKLFPIGTTSQAMDWVLALGAIAINGALYGAGAAIIVALWRAAFRRPSP